MQNSSVLLTSVGNTERADVRLLEILAQLPPLIHMVVSTDQAPATNLKLAD